MYQRMNVNVHFGVHAHIHICVRIRIHMHMRKTYIHKVKQLARHLHLDECLVMIWYVVLCSDMSCHVLCCMNVYQSIVQVVVCVAVHV